MNVNGNGKIVVKEEHLFVLRIIHAKDPKDCECECHHPIKCRCVHCEGFELEEKAGEDFNCDCGIEEQYDLF